MGWKFCPKEQSLLAKKDLTPLRHLTPYSIFLGPFGWFDKNKKYSLVPNRRPPPLITFSKFSSQKILIPTPPAIKFWDKFHPRLHRLTKLLHW